MQCVAFSAPFVVVNSSNDVQSLAPALPIISVAAFTTHPDSDSDNTTKRYKLYNVDITGKNRMTLSPLLLPGGNQPPATATKSHELATEQKRFSVTPSNSSSPCKQRPTARLNNFESSWNWSSIHNERKCHIREVSVNSRKCQKINELKETFIFRSCSQVCRLQTLSKVALKNISFFPPFAVPMQA